MKRLTFRADVSFKFLLHKNYVKVPKSSCYMNCRIIIHVDEKCYFKNIEEILYLENSE